MNHYFLGIDVAKAHLDCHLLNKTTGKSKTKRVANTKVGISALLKSLAGWNITLNGLTVIIEPTSTYHELVATDLHDLGGRVCLVNPAKLRYYARGIGVHSKNDGIDARLLAHYGSVEPLQTWQAPSEAVRTLKMLLARRDALAEDLQRERNRGEKYQASVDADVIARSIAAGITFLEQQLKKIDEEIRSHIDNHPDLGRMDDLMQTIPGVGPRVSSNLTALFGAITFDRAEQVGAYAGLVPVEWQSGSSIRGKARLSKAGPAKLRRLLYMPAVVAAQKNPDIKAIYDRLLAAGKSKMAALGAAMRKLVQLCFGVVRSNKPYDPQWQQKAARKRLGCA
jgi:transposase